MPQYSLTSKELQYLTDTDFLRTKSVIYQKTDQLLSTTQQSLKEYVKQKSPVFSEDILVKGGKISRGENYQSLPYHVLDYPRRFANDDTFALRTMVWWGNHISLTIHLAGYSLDFYRTRLRDGLFQLQAWNWQVCIGSDPWQYHQEESYYQSAQVWRSEAWAEWIKKRAFCKFTVFLPLANWDQLPEEAVTFLDRIVTLLDL